MPEIESKQKAVFEGVEIKLSVRRNKWKFEY